MRRASLLILASTAGMVGWGTVLPYQYAYAAHTRGWGAMLAAGAASLFSVGALVAAPLGGRLTDRYDPVAVAFVAKLVAAAGAGWLALAGSPGAFLAAMLAFGVGMAAAGPAQSVLVLRWVGSGDRRKVFALQFTGVSVGMAVGAFAAGFLVDLGRSDGMVVAFLIAAAGFLVSAGLLLLAARKDDQRGGSRAASAGLTAGAHPTAPAPVGTWAAIRTIVRTPVLRWTALITVMLALGFYAQFESGLPAYAITVLGVSPRTIGTASAVNCLVIVALQMLVVRWTAKRSSPTLLLVVGSIWVLSWGVLAVAAASPALAGMLFVAAFGVFAVGETMYAPVLNPLTAALSPPGTVGTMLGIFAALQTGVSAVGPLVSGVILGAGHGNAFVAVHIVISLAAVAAAWRLRVLLAGTARRGAAAGEHAVADDAWTVEAPNARGRNPVEMAGH